MPYTLSELQPDVREETARGNEVAVHGIDAWRDERAGCEERAEVQKASGGPVSGVRMHWLYFDAQAPQRLEAAGFGYDSTWGYNAGIGYRSGRLVPAVIAQDALAASVTATPPPTGGPRPT